nr:magnesium chelatase domain-containing protein [Nitrosomonas nitrosa]
MAHLSLNALDGIIVDVEVDFNPRAALPSFTIVGLPDTSIKESRERVRSAIKNSNRATSQRLRGGFSPGIDLSGGMPRDQKQHRREEHGFGLQFPNCTQDF